ncbi:MAG: PhaM family polyhydroxyalkanoate granule multifunctional regulatory protein, partial [Burkholderiales bacterium]
MSDTPQDPFEMFKRLWGPLGVPLPGMAMPTFDPREIEKRINELKSVEAWLTMNLSMLRMAIQGLEVQRAALLAMQAAIDPGKQQATPGGPQPNPMLWPWAAMQQAMIAKVPAPPQAAPGGDKKK